VLVVQHERPDYFDQVDIMGMRAIASQLAGAMANVRMLIEMSNQMTPPQEKSKEKRQTAVVWVRTLSSQRRR